jgi:hypothetical protein
MNKEIMKIKKISRFLILVLVLALSACGGSGSSGGSSSGGGSNQGTLVVKVTDAPFPFEFVESATVVINEVWVRNADGSGFEEQILPAPKEIDLKPLTGGVSASLVEAQIPPGEYDQVRLIVAAGTVELSTTAAHVCCGTHTFSTANGNMKFPSGSQSGIKVNIEPPINVVTQLSQELTLDFDLTKSFVFNGPPTHAPGVKGVIFTPVIKAINDSEYGRLTVTVLSDNATPGDTGDDIPLPDATVTVIEASATAPTNGSGIASMQLLPGTYSVMIEAFNYDTYQENNIVDVFLANNTDLEVTLAATLGQIAGVVWSDAGTLSDTDDFVLPGVAVTLYLMGEVVPIDLFPQANPKLTDDPQGTYQFTDLSPFDNYDLSFEKEGFESGELLNVPLPESGFIDPVTLVEVVVASGTL